MKTGPAEKHDPFFFLSLPYRLSELGGKSHKVCLALAAILVIGLPMQAQSLKEKALKYWNKALQPNPSLDSTRIFQPAKRWSFRVGYEMRQVGASIRSDFSIRTPDVAYDFTLTQTLQDRAAHHIGFNVGFGPVSLGYSHEVGRKEGVSSGLSFAYQGTFWGASFRYSKFSSRIQENMELTLPDNPDYDSASSFLSLDPGEMVNLIVDGYYAFNRHRFSYSAAYDGKTIQRKSTGSWIVGAKYMQGGFKLQPTESVLLDISEGIGQYSTYQFSLGGGYSFNWVLFHRDAESRQDFGRLRNLTLNLTAMPMLTVFNRTVTRQYTEVGLFKYSDQIAQSIAMTGNIQPNFMARAGLNWSQGHFYLNLWTDYSMFRFYNGKRHYDTRDNVPFDMGQSGNFTHFRVNFSLSYRF